MRAPPPCEPHVFARHANPHACAARPLQVAFDAASQLLAVPAAAVLLRRCLVRLRQPLAGHTNPTQPSACSGVASPAGRAAVFLAFFMAQAAGLGIYNVSRPLNSVGRICGIGKRVMFGKRGGVIWDIATNQVTKCSREGDGFYELNLWLKDGGIGVDWIGLAFY